MDENSLDSKTSPEPVLISAQNDGLAAIDARKERALIRKLDFHIVPIMMLMYLFSFLDRVNIGNAKLYGIEEDLHLTGSNYQLAVSLLFVTYCIFEVPSNLLLKRLHPSRFLAIICICWGITSTLTGIIRNFASLIALRLLLGLFEAGLFPGLLTYLTIFYTRDRLALRISYLFVSAALAGALGGLLAYGIGFMDGVAGLRAWRWIMIIEGIPVFLLGFICWALLPNDPETTPLLSAEERVLLQTIRAREPGITMEAQKMHVPDVLAGARDWKLWIFSAAAFCLDTMLYSFSTFLPTIIEGIGTWSTTESQALTVPVYALGAITYIAVAILSDRLQQRGIFAAASCLVCIVGYTLLISNRDAVTSYAGCFIVACGLYVSIGIALAWLPSNCPRYGKRALATGMQLTFGNASGVAAPFLFQTKYAPKYFVGYGVTIALLFIAMSIFVVMHLYWKSVNKRRAGGHEDWKLSGRTEQEVREMGDASPHYVFNT